MKMRTLFLVLLLSGLVFAQNGSVNFIIGNVQIQLPGETRWKTAKIGQEMPARSKVKTLAESRCEIMLADGSVIKVLENTEVNLNKLGKTEKEETSIFSPFGELFLTVKSIFTRNFKVETPVAVMAVRGTQFYVINSPRGNALWVSNGRVDLTSTSGGPTVTVPAGKKSTVIAGGKPSAPADLSAVEKKLLKEMSVVQPKIQTTPKKSKAPSPEDGIRKTVDEGAGEIIGPGIVAPPQTTSDDDGSGPGFAMAANVGAVTLDGKIHSQIGLRPEFTLGKLGIGLDLTIYVDENGDINDQNWDSPEDIIHKFMYIRWGRRGDPFHARVGAINDYSMGFGMLLNRYNNVILYPDQIKTGMVVGGGTEDLEIEVMVNDWAETFRQGGFYSARVAYKTFAGIKLGASIAYDHNQYKSLRDDDEDNVPNIVDDFPKNSAYAVDTDGDGIPDGIDPDQDGNGYTDNSQDSTILNNDPFFDPSKLKQPYYIDQADDKEQMAYSVDLSMPIVNNSLLSMTVYADYSQFLYDEKGYGITAPGIVGKIGFFDFKAAYRMLGKNFLPEYFNTTYEVDRTIPIQDESGQTVLITKRQGLKAINDEFQGFLVGAGFDIFDLFRFSAEYQNMQRKGSSPDSLFNITEYKTIRANFDVNTSFIPKISQAGAYYYDMNAEKLFKRNPGTIFGVKLGYEITPGASLIVDVRETYKDLNGNGQISDDEIYRTTYISTVFSF